MHVSALAMCALSVTPTCLNLHCKPAQRLSMANVSRAGQARRLAWKRWRECGQRSRRQSESPCRRA